MSASNAVFQDGAILKSERGQGVLEYILVLFITMVIILGLVYEFNAKFRSYAEAFFGNYIACLLETGELPGSSSGQCGEEMPTFKDQQGKGLLKFADGGGGSGGGKGGDSKGKSTSSSSSSSSGNSGHPSELVRSGSSNNFGNFGQGRERSTSLPNSSTGKKEADAAGYGSLSPNSTYMSGGSGAGLPPRVTYYDNSEGEDAPDPGKAARIKTDKKAELGNALKPRRAFETGSRAPASAVMSDSGGFSFGAMIRWLIIGALIVAIVIFFGSQLMAIMRSREKGGD